MNSEIPHGIVDQSLAKTNKSIYKTPIGSFNNNVADTQLLAFQPLAYMAGVSSNGLQSIDTAFDDVLVGWLKASSCDNIFNTKVNPYIDSLISSPLGIKKSLVALDKFVTTSRDQTNYHMNVTNLYNRYIRNDNTGNYDALFDSKLNAGPIMRGISDTYRYVCTTLLGNFELMIDFMESLTLLPARVAKLLFSQIDKLHKFAQALMSGWELCIKSKLDGALSFLNSIQMPQFDFTFLKNLALECPQVFCNLKFSLRSLGFFNCTVEHVNGNAEVSIDQVEKLLNDQINCLKQALIDSVKSGVNFAERQVRRLVNGISEQLQSLVNVVTRIIRRIIVPYLKLITKKHPVPPEFRWLFYTAGNCNKVKTASLIDWYKALDSFGTCVETLCSLLSKEVKDKIYLLDHNLRIQFKWWKDYSVAYDLLSMLDPNKDSNKIRAYYIASPPTDSIGKDISDQLDGYILPSTNDKVTSVPLNVYPFTVINGSTPFYDGIEPQIMGLYNSLNIELYMYESDFADLGKWDSYYKKSSQFIDLKVNMINQLTTIDDHTPDQFQSVIITPTAKPLIKYVTPPKIDDRFVKYKTWFESSI